MIGNLWGLFDKFVTVIFHSSNFKWNNFPISCLLLVNNCEILGKLCWLFCAWPSFKINNLVNSKQKWKKWILSVDSALLEMAGRTLLTLINNPFENLVCLLTFLKQLGYLEMMVCLGTLDFPSPRNIKSKAECWK